MDAPLADRTKTPSIHFSIRRQKRPLPSEDCQKDTFIEGVRKTLREMKEGKRVVSPLTLEYAEDLLNICGTALSMEEKGEEFFELKDQLEGQMRFLSHRLAEDERLKDEVESLQQLGIETTLMKYGDYCAAVCNDIRAYSKSSEGKTLIRGRRWDDILEDIDNEQVAMVNWKKKGSPRDAKPSQTIKNLLKESALQMNKFDYDHLVDLIRYYTERNAAAHSGLNAFISSRKWTRLALILRKDWHAIQRFYPLEKDQERVSALRAAIEMVQGKYFESIDEEWIDETLFTEFILKKDVFLEDLRLKTEKESGQKKGEINATDTVRYSGEISHEEKEERQKAQEQYKLFLDQDKHLHKRIKKAQTEADKALKIVSGLQEARNRVKGSILSAKERLNRALERRK